MKFMILIFVVIGIMIHLIECDVLAEMNQHLRMMYAKARDKTINNLSYLKFNGASISLYDNDTLIYTSEDLITNTTYDYLKETSHLTLGIFSVFYNNCKKMIPQDTIDDLMGILYYLKQARSLKRNNLNSTMVDLQKRLFGVTEWFIIRTLEFRQSIFDCDKLEIYRNLVNPIMKANIYESAKIHLEKIDQEMKYIKNRFSYIDWDNIYILSCGVHMPREKNLASLYFMKFFNITVEGDRFIYSEDPTDDGCRRLFATHLIDEGLSRNFFNESLRMHRDLLGDDAELILKSMI